MMQLSALAASGLIAGCGGDGGGGDSGDSGGDTTTTSGGETTTTEGGSGQYDHVEGQEFRTYIDRPMSEIETVNFFHLDTHGFYRWEHLTNEIPVFGPWCHSDFLAQGEMNYRWYDDVVSEPDRIEVTVSDDARWSNGDPITGYDVAIEPIVKRLSISQNPFQDVAENGPANVIDTITDYDADETTATWYSDDGGFGTFVERAVWLEVLVENAPRYPTHLEPWSLFADRMFDVMDQAVAGEVDPWATDDPTLDEEVKTDLWGEDREEMHRKYRNPDNVVTNGAWTLERIEGDTAMLLEPNPEHRHADQINFDRVRMAYMESENVVWTNLESGMLDMAKSSPPPEARDSFAEQYDIHLAPDDNGISMVCNGKHELVGQPRVRQALSAALDTVNICETLRPTVWEPTTKPGDTFAKPAFLDQEWFDENLQDYSQDLEFAAELMREAGYERNSDNMWVDGDGEVAELEVLTDAETVELEELVVDRFQSFGVDATVTPLESATFETELNDGSVPMWRENGNSGSAYTTCTQWGFMGSYRPALRSYEWVDQDVEEIEERIGYDGDFPTNYNPEVTEFMTIEAPPVGEFWGEPQTYRPVTMAQRLDSRQSEYIEDVWPKLLWIANWYQPGIPIAVVNKQFFRNADNWIWGDHQAWDHAGVTTRFMPENILGLGNQVFADPDNPK